VEAIRPRESPRLSWSYRSGYSTTFDRLLREPGFTIFIFLARPRTPLRSFAGAHLAGRVWLGLGLKLFQQLLLQALRWHPQHTCRAGRRLDRDDVDFHDLEHLRLRLRRSDGARARLTTRPAASAFACLRPAAARRRALTCRLFTCAARARRRACLLCPAAACGARTSACFLGRPRALSCWHLFLPLILD